MSSQSEIIWESRYRYLETQFEFLVTNLSTIVEAGDRQSGGAKLMIRKIIIKDIEDGKLIYCVADGTNLGFCFEVYRDTKLVHSTGYQRLNSYLVEDLRAVNRCRVKVISYESNKEVEEWKKV
ncbi:MAG: hypothetical protein Q4P66_08795 [Actinomycetaceae bacterium]|nr:hypothetical protein [Actinomycetaceae bacterium]